MENLIFYKKARKHLCSNYVIQTILRNMPEKEGYNKVYMPYGKNGRGFYYVKQKEEMV